MHGLSLELLVTLLSASEDAAFVKDRQGRYLAINAAGAEMLGRSRADVIGETDAGLFEASTAEKMMARDQAIMDGGLKCTYEDIAIIEGRSRWFRTTKGPRCDADGRVNGLWGISRDVTEERENRLERDRLVRERHDHVDELNAIEGRLADVERLASLGRLAAVVAHEIRNPLAVIRNAAVLARKRSSNTAGPPLFDIIEEEVVRLNRLVEDLLDFARPSALLFVPTQIGPLVKYALDRVLLGQPPKGVHVSLSGLDSPATASIDERLFVRALVNVFENAFQAMEQGGRLTVDVAIELKNARVCISDSGSGFTETARAHMFQPFFTTKATGTGLGLYVVKRIIDDHGGAASIVSDDAGTRVTLRIPLAHDP